MLKGKFVSNCLESDIDEIKFAALYYDEIDVVKNIIYNTTKPDKNGDCTISKITECCQENFYTQLKLLEREGVLNFYESKEMRIFHAGIDKNSYISEFDSEVFEAARKMMDQVGNKIFQTLGSRQANEYEEMYISEEAKKVYTTYFNELKIGASINLTSLVRYYEKSIFEMLRSMYNGENTITSSKIVNDYFNSFYMQNIGNVNMYKKNITSSGNIGIRTISQLVPNVSCLSFEEILEIRHKCKDELENYRDFVSQINKQIISADDYDRISKDINQYIDDKIRPALKDLENKMSKSKINIKRSFLESLKDMKSYASLLGTLLLNVPEQINLLIILGLISAETYLKWKENNIDIKNNGLYYLYDIKKQI